MRANVGLLVREIVDDVRAARAIKDRIAKAPEFVGIQQGGIVIAGALGEQLARTAHNIDSFRDFTAERLSGGLRLRILGVALFVAGAGLAFAAGLIDAL